MAVAKKSSKKTETHQEEPKEQLKIDPEAPGEDLTNEDWARMSATTEGSVGSSPNHTDEYIDSEYPWFETTQNIPWLLKVLVREVVKGRLG